MTGSSDIPVFGSVAWDGHVALKFGEPLDAGGDTMCHKERVRSLVDQYVVLFHEMWAKIP
ncbi:MAG: hypothetical protein O2931_17350 [Planctomycetota bacterium]|nr:hypothetical protein [Planctomycetota bacterium]MDA1180548.1 hypothetical protein [Planctomycetota bacterium]